MIGYRANRVCCSLIVVTIAIGYVAALAVVG